MELELRPRRSPFETGNTKASLATPSCCCCCCCVNVIGAAGGMVGADLSIRARNAGRSTGSALSFGVLGFLFIPAVIALSLFVMATVLGSDGAFGFGAGVIIFLVLHTVVRGVASKGAATFSPAGISSSIGILAFVGIVSFGEALAWILLLVNLQDSDRDLLPEALIIGLLTVPVAVWLGWKLATLMHDRREEPYGDAPAQEAQELG